VVPLGQARPAAEALAREIAAFPQGCMLADRRSAIRSLDLELPDALRAEHHGGVAVLAAEGLSGARAFASGEGRHGKDRKPGG
jgi:enoyl-CoA hydratase